MKNGDLEKERLRVCGLAAGIARATSAAEHRFPVLRHSPSRLVSRPLTDAEES